MIDGGQVFKLTAAHFGCGLGGASSGLAQAGYQVTGYVFPGPDESERWPLHEAFSPYPYATRLLKRPAKGHQRGRFGPSLRAFKREMGKGYEYDFVWVTVQNLADACEFVRMMTCWGGFHWAVEVHDPGHPPELQESLDFWSPVARLWAARNGELDPEDVPAGMLGSLRSHPPGFLHVGGTETRLMFSSLWAVEDMSDEGYSLPVVDVGQDFERQSRQMFAQDYAGGVLEQGDQCPWLSPDEAAGETHPGIARSLGLLARDKEERHGFRFAEAP